MLVYFRTCELQKTISYLNRWKNYNKTEILKRCWLSVQDSVSSEDHIFILEDNLSKETLDWLVGTSKTTVEIIPVPPHEWTYGLHTIKAIELLEKNITLYPEDDHFLLEDDYLFVPNGFSTFKIAASGWNQGFIVPYDYIERYKNIKPTQIILGPDRHWRTVDSATMTIAAKGSFWRKYLKELKEAAPTSNDAVFNKILSETPCLAPIPTLSSHLTENLISPFMDVDSIWDYYGNKI